MCVCNPGAAGRESSPIAIRLPKRRIIRHSLERVLPPGVEITLVAILLLFQSDIAIEHRLLDRRAARKLINSRVLIIGGFLDTMHTPRQKRHLRNYAAEGLARLFLKAGRVRPLWCNELPPNF